MAYQVILLFHVLAAVCIVALVLVQQGKGATMGAAFGSGASQTVFGSRGSGSFLFKVTMAAMLFFFVTSLTLNYLTTQAYKKSRVITLPAEKNHDKVRRSLGSMPQEDGEDRVLPTVPVSPSGQPSQKP